MRRGRRPGTALAVGLLLGGCGGEHEVELALQYCLQAPETISSVEVRLQRGEPFTEVPSEQPVGVTVTLDAGDLVYRISSGAPGFPNTSLYLSGQSEETMTVAVRALGFDGYVLAESPSVPVSLSSPDLVVMTVTEPGYTGDCIGRASPG